MSNAERMERFRRNDINIAGYDRIIGPGDRIDAASALDIKDFGLIMDMGRFIISGRCGLADKMEVESGCLAEIFEFEYLHEFFPVKIEFAVSYSLLQEIARGNCHIPADICGASAMRGDTLEVAGISFSFAPKIRFLRQKSGWRASSPAVLLDHIKQWRML